MIGLCQEEGIGVIPWSPLARGKLTRPWEDEPSTKRAETDQASKRFYPVNESDKAVVAAVAKVAADRGVPQAQVALAWLLSRPGVTAPIVGASKPHHLEDAIAGLSVTLTPDEIAALEEPYVPHAVSGFV
jgi:1-deoxyxylulose-5-phosphate synthase